MKKWIALGLALVLLFAVAACGKKNTEQPGNKETKPAENNKPAQTAPAAPETTAPVQITPETWGVTTSYLTEKGGKDVVYRVNTPYYTGNNVGDGNVTEQMDGTMTLVSGQMESSPETEGLAQLLPDYQSQVEYTLSNTFGILSSNFTFVFGESEPTPVNDKEMYIFRGEVSFLDDQKPRTLPFVAYATVVEGNGAYAYWMVFDITDSNGAAELLEQHAYNMALTYRETK